MKAPWVWAVVGLLLLGGLIGCSTGQGTSLALEAGQERHHRQSSDSSKPDPTPAPPPTPTLTVDASPRQAQIFVDGHLAGTGHVRFDSSGLGRKATIEVRAPSYRSRVVDVVLWGQTDTLSIDLTPILGTLRITGPDLAGARFSLGGPSLTPGLAPGDNRVLIGSGQLSIRKFGFLDQTRPVLVEEDRTTEVAVTFDPAPFDLVGPTNDKPFGFNPDSAGAASKASLRFQATAPGHALLVLTDSRGAEVGRWPFDELTSWDQTALWSGREASGRGLADGTYTLTLTGGPEAGVDTVHRVGRIVIDRSLLDRDRASFGPAAGLLWAPTAEVLSPGTVQASLLTLAHGDEQILHAPVSASLRASPAPGWEVSTQAAANLWSDPLLNAALVSFAVKRAIPLDHPGVRAAWLVGGTLGWYLDDDRFEVPVLDSLTVFPALRAAVPLSWTAGSWTLLLAGEVDGSYFSPATAFEAAALADEGWRLWGYARGGLSYDPGPVSLGLSAACRTDVRGHGIGCAGPLHLGLEARLPLEATPFTLSAYASVSAYAPHDWAGYGGFGVSVLLPPEATLDLVSQLSTSP